MNTSIQLLRKELCKSSSTNIFHLDAASDQATEENHQHLSKEKMRSKPWVLRAMERLRMRADILLLFLAIYG